MVFHPGFWNVKIPGDMNPSQSQFQLRVAKGNFSLGKHTIGEVHGWCFNACKILERHHFFKPSLELQGQFLVDGFCCSLINHEGSSNTF